jgi:hypothetical protein
MKGKECNKSSYGDLIIEIGCLFINKSYKEKTLEGPGKENLIINLSAFDCMTFVETVLSLALCAAYGKISRNEFRKNLTLIRYRNGKIDGYSSRLHYFIDWLRDNEKKKILKNVSKKLWEISQHKKINFMTTHRELYPAIANKTQLIKMLLIEKNISSKLFHVIGKNRMNSLKEKISNGDIIAFAAKQEGLDVAHVGFALWQGKNLCLLHASSKEGKVTISKETLVNYLKSNKNFTGIIVARPSF